MPPPLLHDCLIYDAMPFSFCRYASAAIDAAAAATLRYNADAITAITITIAMLIPCDAMMLHAAAMLMIFFADTSRCLRRVKNSHVAAFRCCCYIAIAAVVTPAIMPLLPPATARHIDARC